MAVLRFITHSVTYFMYAPSWLFPAPCPEAKIRRLNQMYLVFLRHGSIALHRHFRCARHLNRSTPLASIAILLLVNKAAQMIGSCGVAEFSECLRLNLADTLSRDIKLFTHFF